MSEFEASILQRESFVENVVVLPEVDSTNAYLSTLLRSKAIVPPALCVAEKQTHGRGQREKKWWSGQGSLTFTVALHGTKPADSGLVAIGSAIAVCDAVRHFHAHLHPKIKWPNDVLLNGKKICGILIENLSLANPALLVGIGINTNCRFEDASEELRKVATSLFDETGQDVLQQEFLLQLLKSLNLWIARKSSKGIIDTFMNNSQFKKGETISVNSSRFATVQGQFNGIGSRGQLILLVNGKSFAIESGSIISTH